jgi:hypothetical protein
MRTTQRKGDIASAQAVARFTALGFDVSIPFTESAAYDLIVDDGTGLYRVQVKYCSTKHVDLRKIHSNSQGYVVKFAQQDEYDWLYVLRPCGDEFLVRECLAGRTAITPNDSHRLPPLGATGIGSRHLEG